MEFGPRALGNRSILGDPRSPKMQKKMNLKIKYRESFRPFAPSILYENVNEYFNLDTDSPYMLLVSDVKDNKKTNDVSDNRESTGIDRINQIRSEVPAITHIDYSARIQTVRKTDNLKYYKLLKSFKARTDCPLLVNTSFNVRGEPLVESPIDAYKCFMRTEMDYLVLDNILLIKSEQPEFIDDLDWKSKFKLD